MSVRNQCGFSLSPAPAGLQLGFHAAPFTQTTPGFLSPPRTNHGCAEETSLFLPAARLLLSLLLFHPQAPRAALWPAAAERQRCLRNSSSSRRRKPPSTDFLPATTSSLLVHPRHCVRFATLNGFYAFGVDAWGRSRLLSTAVPALGSVECSPSPLFLCCVFLQI